MKKKLLFASALLVISSMAFAGNIFKQYAMIQVYGQPVMATEFCIDGDFFKADRMIEVCTDYRDTEGERICNHSEMKPAVVSRTISYDRCVAWSNHEGDGPCIEWRTFTKERPLTYTTYVYEAQGGRRPPIFRGTENFTLSQCE